MNSKISWNLSQFPEIEEWLECLLDARKSAQYVTKHKRPFSQLVTAAFDKANRNILRTSELSKQARKIVHFQTTEDLFFYISDTSFSIFLNFRKFPGIISISRINFLDKPQNFPKLVEKLPVRTTYKTIFAKWDGTQLYFVAVTGSTWNYVVICHCGCYEGYTWCLLEGCRVHPVTATYKS